MMENRLCPLSSGTLSEVVWRWEGVWGTTVCFPASQRVLQVLESRQEALRTPLRQKKDLMTRLKDAEDARNNIGIHFQNDNVQLRLF